MIHIPVRRDRYCTPTDHGIRRQTSAGNIIWFKQYKTRACRNHVRYVHDVPDQRQERLIHRSEYADYYERNRINTIEKEHLYKRRQAIVEHPYGTIKRSMGGSVIF